MQRACPAECDKREIARIVTLADRNQAHRIGHVGVGNLEDRKRGLLGSETKRLGDPFGDGFLCEVTMKPDGAACERRTKTPKHHVGVGVGRLRAALVVAGRTRAGAGRLRPVAQRSALVDPGERTATGTDCQHFDAREADRIAVFDMPVLGDRQDAAVAKTDVRAGPAHVEADRVFETGKLRHEAACDCAGGNARGRESRREFFRRFCRHDAAAGMQQKQVFLVAAIREALGEVARVVARHRGQHGVRDRGRETLMLEDFRHDVARDRNCRPGQFAQQNVAHAVFVARIRERIDEADGDGLYATLADDVRDLDGLGLVDLRNHLSRIIDPLGDDETVAAADVGSRHFLVGVPEIVARAAPDFDHVLKAPGRDHNGGRETPRDQGVGCERCAVREQHHVLELDAAELDAFDHAVDRIGGGRRLGHVHLAGILVKDAKIGKSSADIASHSEGHFPLAFTFYGFIHVPALSTWLPRRLLKTFCPSHAVPEPKRCGDMQEPCTIQTLR